MDALNSSLLKFQDVGTKKHKHNTTYPTQSQNTTTFLAYHGVKLDIGHGRASLVDFMRHQFVPCIFVPIGNHSITAAARKGVEVVEVQRVHAENVTAVSAKEYKKE